MTAYRRMDTNQANGFYVSFEPITCPDLDSSPLDWMDEADEQDAKRIAAWRNDEWYFIGIQAKATCLLVQNRVGTLYTLTSPGLWGTENDSDPAYLESIYQDEIAILKSDLGAMHDPIYAG